MKGYDVITSDEQKAGQVVRTEDGLLIVESGLVRKTERAIPLAFAQTDESEQVVRLSVSKEIVESSPEIEDGNVDRTAVAQHYGLAEGFEAPETQGYGEVTADDPAWSAESDAKRAGLEPGPERRARIREGESDAGPHGRQIIPPDPHEGP